MTEPDGIPCSPDGDPSSAATARVGARDGGVSRRLTVRCRIAASVLCSIGALLLVGSAVRSWNTVAAGQTLVAAAVLVGAVLLTIRARMWSAVAKSDLLVDAGLDAVVGAARSLSPGVPGAPVKRRLGAAVVPIRLASGPQPGGGALVVHARADDSTLVDRDEVLLWRVDSRGVTRMAAGSLPASQSSSIGGRFVLLRRRDGAVFLATSRLTDTW